MTAEVEMRVRRCAEEVVIAVRSDPSAAERLVRELEAIARENPATLIEAFRHRASGHLHHTRGCMPDAVACYRQALLLFERCNESVEWARTASTLVGSLVPLGEFEEALTLAEKARQVFQAAGLELRAARLDVNVGNLYHRLNRLDDALLHYERAALILEESNDCEAAAGVLINRSVVLMLLYRFDDALSGYVRARRFSEEHGLKAFATQSEYNRAYLHFLLGDYTLALNLMRTAEAGFENLGDEIHVAHCRLDRAEILLELNLPEHALELARLAEQGFHSSALNGDRSRALLLMGRALTRLGHTGEALKQYRQASQLFQAEGNGIWAAMADLETAAALDNNGDRSPAIVLAERAADLLRTQKHHPFSAVADALCARLSIACRDVGRAMFYLNRCETSLQSAPPAFLRFHISYLKGRAHELQGNRAEARSCFHEAKESLEFLLAHIFVEHALVRFLEDKDDVYARLAGLTDDLSEMFEFVDRARSRALFTRESLRHSPDMSPLRVQQLRESLRSDHLRLFQTGESNSGRLLEKIQRGEQQLMQELMDWQLLKGSPAAVPAVSEPVSLSGDEVLLEYFIHDESVSVFVVADGCLDRVELPISPAELREEVDLTRYGLSRPGDARREAALQYHLRRLYSALIEPLTPFLRRRLVIVSHRFLNHLAFHLLLGPSGHIGEEYLISYAPNKAAYLRASRKESVASARSLIIGASPPDLPAIQHELREVADRLPNCRVAVNENLADVREALETSAFIHIVSHGVFRSDNPAWSLLSLGSDVLTPTDLLDLRVNAELVTMSSCSSAQSYARGNEVQGFVWAFLQWNVPSLIASLWEVNDEATYMLMRAFYERVQSSRDIADSLRLAMLDVKQRFPHPYYWGGFVLIGRQKLKLTWPGTTAVPGRNCTDLRLTDTWI